MTGRKRSSPAIWSLAHPLAVHADHQELYGHFENAAYAADRGCFRLAEHGRFWSDRLLNVFALRKWRKLTAVRDLTLAVAYSGGACSVSVMSYDGAVRRVVAKFRLEPSAVLKVEHLRLTPGGGADYLYLHFEADAATDVYEASFVTDDPALHDVRLGIAITTYNRPDDVEAQVVMLEALALKGLAYEVLIVDNGSNLEFARAYANTRVIDSPNLGGAGGFARGLLEIEAAGGFTHAMFMDDDAFCHPEAILRAVALLRHAKDPRLALTGAMNYLERPEVQYELGGEIADYGVRSIRMNVESNDLRALFDNDAADTPAYGAWWCFIFPLAAAVAAPFPFFVRGDDITFSLQNRFKLETMPGLLAWQPSFEYKIGASVEYLVHRSFLALPLIVGRDKWKLDDIVSGVRHAFENEVDGLRYPIGEGICDALEDVLTGPDFWRNTANTVARMQELGRMEAAFTKRSFQPNWIFHPHDVEARRSMRWLRARFGQINLPAKLCWRRPALTNDMFPKRGQAAFRTGMIYFAPDGSRQLSCVRDWRWRRRLERRFEGLIAEYETRFKDLGRIYASARDLQARDQWRARFAGQAPELSLAHTAV